MMEKVKLVFYIYMLGAVGMINAHLFHLTNCELLDPWWSMGLCYIPVHTNFVFGMIAMLIALVIAFKEIYDMYKDGTLNKIWRRFK